MKTLTLVAALLVIALATMGADSCSSTGGAIDTNPSATDNDTATEESGGDTGAAQPPQPKAPKPVVLRGHGKVVDSVKLATETPVVVTGAHSGQANFIVDLVGRGTNANLFNEIGRYAGQSMVEDPVQPGKYRVAVEADGDWTLKFEQPVPNGKATKIPGRLKGHGARVVAVHSDDDMQPVVGGTHNGQANFIVDAVGYGDLSGYMNFFNEIGRFYGEVLAPEEMPAGDYLVWVQADGGWTLKFSP